MDLRRHYVNSGKLLTLELGSPESRSQPRDSKPRRQRQRRLTTKESNKLADQYRSGLTVRQLAAKWGIHRTTVLRHLERHGVERRPNRRKLTDASANQAAQLYCKGQSLSQVARQFDVNPTTLRNELDRAGVTVRSRRGWAPT